MKTSRSMNKTRSITSKNDQIKKYVLNISKDFLLVQKNIDKDIDPRDLINQKVKISSPQI